MSPSWSRRQFLHQVAGCGAVAAGLCPAGAARAAEKALPRAPDHSLTVISGKPRERGRHYGHKFKDEIHSFLDKEIYQACAKYASRERLLRYAGQCTKAVKQYSPAMVDEMEGMAEGAGLRLEEAVLITLHEETAGHKDGVLPPVQHCTALAAGPPDTKDSHTYVGQNWDWMASVYGLSRMLLWKRPEGPSLLAYSYPGLWIGAGLNSAGIALCWTWGAGLGIKGPRVGIPSYVLIAQMLYQDSLEGALQEARRARHAGWFAFVLADGKGRLATVEGTPEKLVVGRPRGHTARASFACRELLGGSKGAAVKVHPQCRRMFDLLAGARGKLDRLTLQGFFGDHKSTICKHPAFKKGGSLAEGGFTVDSMLFDCTTKEAHVSRGPGCAGRWKTFRLD
ncbi:MAG TPA: C45 family peptidase [Gemmataceae bacterium]|jgi:isopenicillin-N N-acyltransferase-like protein|nr:C45 family peptidase [Gemmataceae bacterium]